MVIYSTDSTYALEPGRMLRIERAAGWQLRCDRGTVLVTQPGDDRDVVLRAGLRMVIATGGRVLVEGGTPARIALLPPGSPGSLRQRLAEALRWTGAGAPRRSRARCAPASPACPDA